MCTVSWLHKPEGYHLFCNRDEKHSRAAGLGPQIHCRRGVSFIRPADGDFGGTWIAVNQFGVSACLLNREAAVAKAAYHSRGLLLPEIISETSADASARRLRGLGLSSFAPFTVVLLEPSRPAIVVEWDGEHTAVIPSADHLMPLASSSRDPEGVRAHRRQQFQRHLQAQPSVDSASLYRFHTHHGSHPDAYSPCMHRDDAETVSFSWVVVTPSQIRFFYSPSAPCRWSRGEQQILTRAA